MADNIIQRIVRLVFDRKSGKETSDAAKKQLGAVDDGLSKLKKGAMAVGAAIAAAFGARAIARFAKEAVAAAAEEEAQLKSLQTAIENTGESWAEYEEDVLAAAAAMQSMTTVGDGDYFQALQRVIAVTGDASASMANMGLIADVAATFFKGEMAPAADLVAKAMNGNVMMLQRMGIVAEDAQGALQILADRSFGAAEQRAQTFSGRVQQLNNEWGDFVEAVGFAITESEGATTAMIFLRDAVESLQEWIGRNKDAIGLWITRGVDFAIASVDVLFRALKGLALILEGALVFAIAKSIRGVGVLVNSYAFAVKAATALAIALGQHGLVATLAGHTVAMEENAKAINDYAAALALLGGADVQAGLDALANPIFTPGQFRPRTAPGGTTTGGATTPRMGRNAIGEDGEKEKPEVDAATQAMEAFIAAGERARVLEALLGEDFDHLGARASALQTVMAALADAGFDENNRTMQGFAEELRIVTEEMMALEAATKAEKEMLAQQAQVAGELSSAIGAAMSGGIGPHAKAKARQNLLEAAELTIRAGIAALTGFGAFHARAFLSGAARHVAVAAGWAALAGATGGGASGGGPASGGAGGGSPAPSPVTTARTSSAGSAARAAPISPEISIHLVGPGFDALNPAVQRVVLGATQEAIERQGNARVRVVRRTA